MNLQRWQFALRMIRIECDQRVLILIRSKYDQRVLKLQQRALRLKDVEMSQPPLRSCSNKFQF